MTTAIWVESAKIYISPCPFNLQRVHQDGPKSDGFRPCLPPYRQRVQARLVWRLCEGVLSLTWAQKESVKRTLLFLPFIALIVSLIAAFVDVHAFRRFQNRKHPHKVKPSLSRILQSFALILL